MVVDGLCKIVNAAARLVKIDLSFLTKKSPKGKALFLQKIEVFWGVTPGPLGTPFIQLYEKLFGV